MTERAKTHRKVDYNALSFQGALMKDGWRVDDEPELSTIHSTDIAEISRACEAITVIARLVRNSISEPDASGAEPLGRSACEGLMSSLEIIGRHVGDLTDRMRQTAAMLNKLAGAGEGGHE